MKKFSTIILLVILTLFVAGNSKDQRKSADGKHRGRRQAEDIFFSGKYFTAGSFTP